MIWLRNILNAVVELEVGCASIQGCGKDPLQVDSFWDVTLTSMVGTVPELQLGGSICDLFS